MLARLQRNERAVFGICLAFSFLLLATFGFGRHMNPLTRQYIIALVLAAITLAAYYGLGIRKDRNYLRGAATFSIVAVLLIYAVLSFAAGIFLGFNRGYFSTDLGVLFSAFVPTLLLVVSVELLRYLISAQYLYSRRSLVVFTALAALLYILVELQGANLASLELVFVFVCTTVFPIIARETLCAYLCHRTGLRPTLIYKLAVTMYPFLLPIVPALGDYLHSVVNVMVPFVIYLVVLRSARFYDQDRKRLRGMNYRLVAIPLLVVASILTALVSGLLPYQLIAIASDSMRPIYSRGDAVIFEKVSATEIAKDDILVFSKDRAIMTHRVVAIENRDNTLYFTTRGDNNEKPDGFETSAEQVLGRVVSVGKYIGFPTVWLSEAFNNG